MQNRWRSRFIEAMVGREPMTARQLGEVAKSVGAGRTFWYGPDLVCYLLGNVIEVAGKVKSPTQVREINVYRLKEGLRNG